MRVAEITAIAVVGSLLVVGAVSALFNGLMDLWEDHQYKRRRPY